MAALAALMARALGGGAYKLNFDLHRAGGLWVWAVIVIVAFTSFSLNLYREVFYPVMSTVSTTTPGPYETLKPAPQGTPSCPRSRSPRPSPSPRARPSAWLRPARRRHLVGRRLPVLQHLLLRPARRNRRHGHGPVQHLRQLGQRRSPGHLPPLARHGRRRLRPAAAAPAQRPHPRHPGRVLMSFVGVLVAVLSITGVIIWWRKRRARKMTLSGCAASFPLRGGDAALTAGSPCSAARA